MSHQQLGVDVTAVSTTAQFTPGTHATDADGKVFKYVQYDTGAGGIAAVSGQVAYYYLASGYDAHKVTSDLSDSVGIGAGVLQSAPTDGQYCWVQIRGPATLSIALTAGADGNALTPVGSTDGTLDVSAAVTDHVCAIADDISAKEIVCMFPE
jgi:hypothetical protein